MYEERLLLQLYRTMCKIRFCEESLVHPIIQGEILCPVHLYSGQEAVAAGVCGALKETDYVFSTHRSHGHFLAKGGKLHELMAEVYCRENGCSRGRGGSMHLVDKEKGFMGSAPIVGGTISLAVGAALASKIRSDGRVTVSFFGDGACGEGTLYESLNFASLKKLPIVFVCENNLYSTHLPIDECRPNRFIFKTGMPFGVYSKRVAGNEVLKVYEAAIEAVEFCRKGRGPVFLECLTYRLRGHVGPDDNVQGCHMDIRPEKEVAEWKRKDPINRFRRYILRNKVATKGDLERIDKKIRAEVERTHEFAKCSNYPVPEEIGKYVFAC